MTNKELQEKLRELPDEAYIMFASPDSDDEVESVHYGRDCEDMPFVLLGRFKNENHSQKDTDVPLSEKPEQNNMMGG